MPTEKVEWVDVRERLPRNGDCVLGAIVGQYATDEHPGPPDRDFWFVFPMHFRAVHPEEETYRLIKNCFIDADGVVRLPHRQGDPRNPEDEWITHWAELPVLPGMPDSEIYGEPVREMLATRG